MLSPRPGETRNRSGKPLSDSPWLCGARLWLFRSIGSRQNRPDQAASQDWLRAAKLGDIAAASEAARRGACLFARDGWGREASHLAASHGQADFLRWVLSLGCSSRSRDIRGWTPAHHAASRAHPEALLAALSFGLHPACADSEGRSVAHLAAQSGCARCLSIALSRGADPFSRDRWGRLCLDLARSPAREMLQSWDVSLREAEILARSASLAGAPSQNRRGGL